MKGIPVLPNGELLRRTFVITQSMSQFGNWCRYSRVNPNSGLAAPVTSTRTGVGIWRGVRDCDFVFTGLWHLIPDLLVISEHVRRIEENPHYSGLRYYQIESADIEPNVVSRYPGQTDD